MNTEKYKPTEEEIELAENLLTYEQKLQSEAHEEGYRLRESLEDKTSTSTESIEKVGKELSFTLVNRLAKVGNENIWGFINAECKLHGVEVKGGGIPGDRSATYRVYFQGEENAVERVQENIIKMLKDYANNNPSGPFGDMFEGSALTIHKPN